MMAISANKSFRSASFPRTARPPAAARIGKFIIQCPRLKPHPVSAWANLFRTCGALTSFLLLFFGLPSANCQLSKTPACRGLFSANVYAVCSNVAAAHNGFSIPSPLFSIPSNGVDRNTVSVTRKDSLCALCGSRPLPCWFPCYRGLLPTAFGLL